MDVQLWVVLALVVVIAAIFVYRRSMQTRDRREQDHRMTVQAQGQAQSPAEEISQREDRRLAGMSAEDRAWEQASLQRQRGSGSSQADG
jgi:flagellar biosynthesis/type III secretory pathway M-ring protein FliF/YscJ